MNQENQLTEQNSEETEIDLLEIFYLLRAKLVWLILAFVIGGVIAGSITHFLITPKYTATAKMYMISASSGSVLDLSDFNIGTSLSQDYTELIKIRPVFNEVIDNLNLDMEYEDLLKKVSISVVGDSLLQWFPFLRCSVLFRFCVLLSLLPLCSVRRFHLQPRHRA